MKYFKDFGIVWQEYKHSIKIMYNGDYSHIKDDQK